MEDKARLLLKPSLLSFVLIFILFCSDNIIIAQTNFYQRLTGDNRYSTSVRVCQAGWESSEYVILATGLDYADALCSGPLAKKYSAPILLIKSEEISPDILEELKRLKTKHVIIVGGPAAISSTVEAQLQETGIKAIERIQGKDRYETSVKIAEKFHSPSEAVLASGQSPWEVLAMDVVAAQKKMPILLTDPHNLPPVVRKYFQKEKINKTYLIGGEKTISSNVASDLWSTRRIAGRDRYEINALILKEFPQQFRFKEIYVITGDEGQRELADAANAFSIAALAAKNSSPLILTGRNLPEIIAEYLKDKVTVASRIIIVGDQAAVSNETVAEIHSIVTKALADKALADKARDTDTGRDKSHLPSGYEDIVIDTLAPKELGISAQNIILGKGSLTLTVVDGPLSANSWSEILAVIKANTGAGSNWITGIRSENLSITPSVDGVTALLSNSNANPARIAADFIIPASKVQDKAGNVAGADIVVDSHSPMMVTEVSSRTVDGHYKEGDIILITVAFDRIVEVEGTPSLQLAAGIPDHSACYTGGSGATQLIFTYLVRSGANSLDLDYSGIDALQVNSGSIKIAGTEINANLILPEPGEVGSLAQNKNIIIDTTAPTAINISAQDNIPPNGSLTLTVLDGPLSSESWTAILNLIKQNTILGTWIAGISDMDLTISAEADGVSAKLQNNNRTNQAIIRADFQIAAAKVIDRAGNMAAATIVIDAKS